MKIIALSEVPAWIVMYRGNGYGLFLNEDIARAFSEFIPDRNEKLFNSHDYGKYEATIIKTNMRDGLADAKKLGI